MKDYFEEIKGYEDIKKELRVISDMLNNQEIYKKLGAKINEGLILVGEPGTGKTSMADCLVRSIGRKAYVIRKNDHDGDFIRSIARTFEDAKLHAPSIVVLDDLDKFSDKGTTENDAAYDAEEFVMIQSCIDETKGFDVFVIATVNNIKKIPDSLLRAGRLGKKLEIRCPKVDEAAEIIKYYLEKANMYDGLDEKSIARMLDGESCATLENVINNAAIKAAFARQEKITMQNIVDTCLDLIFDAPESCEEISENVRRKIAYHEAGHALVGELLDPGSVSIVSIRITDSDDYGFVRYSRSEEEKNLSAEYNEAIIKTSLAGKAATELVFGEADMGVNGDMRNAFRRAVVLVDNMCMYGFQNWIEDGHDDSSAENRNRAAAMLLEKNYLEVKKILVDHREQLDRIAEELMEKTTLVYSDIRAIFEAA